MTVWGTWTIPNQLHASQEQIRTLDEQIFAIKLQLWYIYNCSLLYISTVTGQSCEGEWARYCCISFHCLRMYILIARGVSSQACFSLWQRTGCHSLNFSHQRAEGFSLSEPSRILFPWLIIRYRELRILFQKPAKLWE